MAEHHVEERGERLGRLRPGVVVVAHRPLAEEDAEHRPRPLHGMRDTLASQPLRDPVGDGPADDVEAFVDLRRAAAQRREAGRGGDRVSRQGARLVDRAGRGEQGHDVGATAERRGGKTATHDLAEGEQVRRARRIRALEAVPPGRRAAEPRHHLVADDEGPVLVRDPEESLGEPLDRRDDAHVAGGRLGDDAGDLVAANREGRLDRGEVVVGQHDRLGRRGGRNPGAVRQPERRDARARRGEQRVDMAVVAAGELHDDAPPGVAAGQPNRRHRGLGAAVDQAHLLRGVRATISSARATSFSEGVPNEKPRVAVSRTASTHGRVRVTEDHRPPRADQVDVATTVDVGEPRPRGAGHEPWRAADRPERAHRRVHAARDDRQRPVEEGGRGRRLQGVRRQVGMRGRHPGIVASPARSWSCVASGVEQVRPRCARRPAHPDGCRGLLPARPRHTPRPRPPRGCRAPRRAPCPSPRRAPRTRPRP